MNKLSILNQIQAICCKKFDCEDCPLNQAPKEDIDATICTVIDEFNEIEEELDTVNIRELIRTCLDLDEWKYSWHMPSLDYTDPEIAAEIENIIKHKIQRREKELKMLKSCLKIINDEVNNMHVYCTDCIRGDKLLECIAEEKDIPDECKECYPYDPENGVGFEQRPNYVKRKDE